MLPVASLRLTHPVVVVGPDGPLPTPVSVFSQLFAAVEVMQSALGFFDADAPHVAAALRTVQSLDWTVVAGGAQESQFAVELLLAGAAAAPAGGSAVFTDALRELGDIRAEYLADVAAAEARSRG